MNTDKIFAEKLAEEYAPKNDSKVIALKKLDQKAKNPANIFAYTYGILSTLILGTGMCLSMNIIGGTPIFMILGIIVGIIGFIGVCTNYPIYKRLLAKSRQKYLFEIVQLAKEISEE